MAVFRISTGSGSRLVRLSTGDYWIAVQNGLLYILNPDGLPMFSVGPAPATVSNDVRVKLSVDEDDVLYVNDAPVLDEVDVFEGVKIESLYDVEEDVYDNVADENARLAMALARDENDVVQVGEGIERDVLSAMETLFSDVGIRLPTSRRLYELILDVYENSTGSTPDSIMINVDKLADALADTLRELKDARTGEPLIENVGETARLLAEILASDSGFRAIVAAAVKALDEAEDETEELLTYTYAVKAKIYAISHALDDLPQFDEAKLEALRKSIVRSVVSEYELGKVRDAYTV